MKMYRRMILVLLVVSMLLPGCAAAPEETTPATAATEATEVPTEAATEPVEVLAEVKLPEEDVATGTLCLYFGDKTIYAGGQVADIIDIGVQTYSDWEQMIQPLHMSDVIRVRIEDESVAEKDRPFVFFVAVNTSEEPQMLKDCMIYSLTINTDSGVAFGSGQEQEHFVTGETTLDEMLETYGDPDYESKDTKYNFKEIAYYEPFSCAYFSFKNDKVRQIFTYYSANLFADQAEAFDHELTGYFGNDCYILMDQYLDVEPYLPKEEEETDEEETDKEEKPDDTAEETAPESTTGVLSEFVETITLADQTIELGMEVTEMPSPFKEAFVGLQVPLVLHTYMTVGRVNPEEFWLINENGQNGYLADTLLVKGVITRNRNYSNWGEDNSVYNSFEYDGLTEEMTIEDILEKYGAPKELNCTSTARDCFAWMHYEDENGNYVHFCVDPILDQLVEIRVNKYFPKENHA